MLPVVSGVSGDGGSIVTLGGLVGTVSERGCEVTGLVGGRVGGSKSIGQKYTLQLSAIIYYTTNRAHIPEPSLGLFGGGLVGRPPEDGLVGGRPPEDGLVGGCIGSAESRPNQVIAMDLFQLTPTSALTGDWF